MGLSRREFAKSEGCTEGAVRYALKQGRLAARADGTLDASQLGGRWKRNIVGASKRVKRQQAVAQNVQVAHPAGEIPDDVAHHYGWDDSVFDPETTTAIGILLCIKGDWREDPETVAGAMVLHGVAMLHREASRLGWREDSYEPPKADAVPIGPNEYLSDLTEQLLNFGLVRKLGRAMQSDLPDADPIDVNDPVIVACLMAELANEIFVQELKRRRLGVIGPRD
jgi:hypothetical protein